MNFKEYFTIRETLDDMMGNTLGSIAMPATPFGAVPSSEGKPNSGDPAPIRPTRGDFNLGLPEITYSSPIRWISGPGQQQPGQPTIGNKKNTIHIVLDNGFNMFLTYDQFKRIHGEPRVGKMATVVLQRHLSDTSRIPSQIQSITVS